MSTLLLTHACTHICLSDLPCQAGPHQFVQQGMCQVRYGLLTIIHLTFGTYPCCTHRCGPAWHGGPDRHTHLGWPSMHQTSCHALSILQGCCLCAIPIEHVSVITKLRCTHGLAWSELWYSYAQPGASQQHTFGVQISTAAPANACSAYLLLSGWCSHSGHVAPVEAPWGAACWGMWTLPTFKRQKLAALFVLSATQ